MSFGGILLGAAVFLIIGIFHPIVIKMEYYFGKRSWWILLIREGYKKREVDKKGKLTVTLCVSDS